MPSLKKIDLASLKALLPECCRLGVASLEEYPEDVRRKILELLPSARTVAMVAHHVQDSLEWTWLKFQASRIGEIPPADLHALAMVERVAARFEAAGAKTSIPQYPGPCGLLFKKLAIPTGLGSLGDNFLLLNSEWGPWMHLRALLTEAVVDGPKPELKDACLHCWRCVKACPAGAFKAGDFDGLACRAKMCENASVQSDGSFCFECEICLRACPVGVQPKAVEVRFKAQA